MQQAQHIIASDISPQMLAIARKRLAAANTSLEFRVFDAHSIPEIPSESIDLYSISLGLKICERRKVLQEALRLLRPGGRLIVLEASNFPWRWLQELYLVYMNLCMPVIGWIATRGDSSAYRYLLNGIKEFPPAEEFAQELASMGYIDVAFQRLALGIVAIHTARKPRTRGFDLHHTA
jgi:ubiquinone/menaquinone biosynthesis methyltransferase